MGIKHNYNWILITFALCIEHSQCLWQPTHNKYDYLDYTKHYNNYRHSTYMRHVVLAHSQQNNYLNTNRTNNSQTKLQAAKENKVADDTKKSMPKGSRRLKPETWSRSANIEPSVSRRAKLRTRVKGVLERAKRRTGVNNLSDENNNTSSNLGDGYEVLSDSLLKQLESKSYKSSDNSVNDEEEVKGARSSESSYAQNESTKAKSIRAATSSGSSSSPVMTSSIPPSNSKFSSRAGSSSLSSTSSSSSYSQKSRKSSSTTQNIVSIDNAAEDVDPISLLSADASITSPDPLPFSLPKLNEEQRQLLEQGERVQFQSEMGRAGNGFVCIDVNAPSDAVWNCLLDFPSYPEIIPTVRDIELYTSTSTKVGTASETRAEFTLSKFKLKIAAVHKYNIHPSGDYMVFELDQRNRNFVLQYAKGIWYTQTLSSNKTRVWLLCEIRVSPLLPKFIMDYAAARAMPRATTWLKPQVEAAASLWLKKD